MAVVSWREVMPRTFQHRIGDAPTAERKFVATLDEPTPTQSIIASIGVAFGAPHPEFGYLRMTDGSVSETDRQHAEVTLRYDLLNQEFQPNPLQRPDVWSFAVGGATIPATRYYDINDAVRPLVNAAGDLFENITTEEAEVRAVINGNRPTFPLQLAAFATNAVNNAPYLGGRQFTWKCAGISGQQTTEVVDGFEVRYYQITTELVYRASGWPLLIPDAGFNFIDQQDNTKRRCFVEFKDEEEAVIRVPSANAVPLAGNGAMLAAGQQPRLLSRRVHRGIDFAQYFGNPQF
jgi:hypothetical protein